MAGGLSQPEIAARFGGPANTALKRAERFDCYRATGSAARDRTGGHTPKNIVGGRGEWLRRRCRERNFTLRGQVRELAGERAIKDDERPVSALVRTEKLLSNKRRGSPVSTITATSPGAARTASSIGAASVLPNWRSATVGRDRSISGAA